MENPDIDLYIEQDNEDARRLDGLDYAVIGVDQKGNLVSVHYRMVEQFMYESDMSK